MLTDTQLAAFAGKDDLTDAEFEIADALDLALADAGPEGLTPSRAARKARTDTRTAERLLRWLVADLSAHTSGNGCWTHYHAGRAS